MPRSLSEVKDNLLRKLIRERELSIRDIAERVGCGVGTVQRRKLEMGHTIRQQTSQRVTRLLASKPIPNMKGGRPPNLDKLDKNENPSPAALRLAAFDPIVRRAISDHSQDEEDADGE